MKSKIPLMVFLKTSMLIVLGLAMFRLHAADPRLLFINHGYAFPLHQKIQIIRRRERIFGERYLAPMLGRRFSGCFRKRIYDSPNLPHSQINDARSDSVEHSSSIVNFSTLTKSFGFPECVVVASGFN